MRVDVNGTIWQVTYFKDVPLRAQFWCNGNKWRKTSTRTAKAISLGLPSHRFYFRMHEICETELHAQESLTGRHAVQVYTLDGLKDGEADFSGSGPVPVYTLDGTARVRVPRGVASTKVLSQDFVYTC